MSAAEKATTLGTLRAQLRVAQAELEVERRSREAAEMSRKATTG
jgi:hypothetical protein